MKRLFGIEWVKTWNYNVFKILGGLYVLLFLISVLILPLIQLKTQMTNDSDILNIKSFYAFPVIWDTFAYLAGKSNLFLAIIIIFLVGNEYSFKTFRQQIMNGLSREELLIGKLIIIVIIALANGILIGILGWIFGLIYTADFSFYDAFGHMHMLAIYFVQAISYMILALFLTIWLRNKTLTIVVFLSYSVLIEPILRLVLNRYVADHLGLYLPVRVTTRLTPIPANGLLEFLEENASANDLISTLPLWLNLVLALSYSILFLLLSRFILKRRDL